MDFIRPIGIEDLGPYQVHSRREILQLLRGIMETEQLVRMIYNEGAEAIVTSILEIDETRSWVVIDCAQQEKQNEAILNSSNISFETMLDRIRILFFTDRVDRCLHNGNPALRFALPTSAIRLQRREYYRVRTPRTPVHISYETEDGIIKVKAYLHDLSAGGVGLVDEQMALDNTIGRIYDNCRITLADKTVIMASLQIRNSLENTLPNGRVVRRLGCQFMGLPNSTLMSLQRFITRVEREQNVKGSRLA